MGLSPNDVPVWLSSLDREALGPVFDYIVDCHDRGLTGKTLVSKKDVLGRAHRELGAAGGLLAAPEMSVRRWHRGLAARGLAPATRSVYLAHLRGFYSWTRREDLREDDPTRRIVAPKVPHTVPRPLRAASVVDLLGRLDGSEWLAIALAYYAGLRAMEIAAVRPGDVYRGEDGIALLHVSGKGRRDRVVPLPPLLAERLAALPDREPAVRTRAGEPFGPAGISDLIARIMRRHGMVGTGHQLRHTFATAVYRKSLGNLLVTQQALGHQTPASTAIYAKVESAELHTAIRATWAGESA